MFRQQALIVSRKKQDALERLQMRQEEQRELEQVCTKSETLNNAPSSLKSGTVQTLNPEPSI